VAEINPGMEIFTSGKGVLLENRNQEVVENSGSYPDFNNLSKTKSPHYSAQKINYRRKEICQCQVYCFGFSSGGQGHQPV
jgi:hypothetical protein